MDSRAQVSFEYLLTLTFVIMLTIAVAALLVTMNNISNTAQKNLLENRSKTISNLMG